MSDESRPSSTTVLHEIPYLRLFPWLRIFQCPGAAADPKRLMLATLGFALTLAGWHLLDGFFPSSAPIVSRVDLESPAFLFFDAGTILARLTEPCRIILAPFLQLFDRAAKASDLLHAALASFWTVIVWGFFGGAIARIAVIRLAKGERMSMRQALRFSIRKSVPLIATPLIPLLGFVVVASGIALFGLLYRLPGQSGSTLAGLLAFLPLFGGLILTLIVIGLVAGWPLMPTSVAAEDEDGFDAMSRAYAYVHQRPWHYGFYVALALFCGMAGWIFVRIFTLLLIQLTAFALGFGGPSEQIQGLYGLRSFTASGTAKDVHAAWIFLIQSLMHGWLYSYFWTVFSAIYLLLRLDVDGTPWSKVLMAGGGSESPVGFESKTLVDV